MRLIETNYNSKYWVSRHGGLRFVAEITFWPEDDWLFDFGVEVGFNHDVREWLRNMMDQRFVSIPAEKFLAKPHVLFLEMNDAIHFKLRWS